MSILVWRSAALEFQGPHQFRRRREALSEYQDVRPTCVDHISMVYVEMLSVSIKMCDQSGWIPERGCVTGIDLSVRSMSG